MGSTQIFWRQNGTRLNEALSVERDAAMSRLTISPTNGFEVIASF